jgi:hypothetical protein
VLRPRHLASTLRLARRHPLGGGGGVLGVLMLKNGSIGSTRQSTVATPWRPVQISILWRYSTTSA